jgi:hypothetical protein
MVRGSRKRGNFSVRLLTKTQAAGYCGVSPATFSGLCPVPPVSLGAGKRLERYDVAALDSWIESLGSAPPDASFDWLSKLDRKNGRNPN